MTQCIVLNVTDRLDWVDQVSPHPRNLRVLGLHVPKACRPSLIHPSREEAEKEAARLACETAGSFAVFELVAIMEGKPLPEPHPVRGMGPNGAAVPRWQTEALEL